MAFIKSTTETSLYTQHWGAGKEAAIATGSGISDLDRFGGPLKIVSDVFSFSSLDVDSCMLGVKFDTDCILYNCEVEVVDPVNESAGEIEVALLSGDDPINDVVSQHDILAPFSLHNTPYVQRMWNYSTIRAWIWKGNCIAIIGHGENMTAGSVKMNLYVG